MARRSNEHWPQDLVTKILLRLPVKSIIRFKCVAKTWSSLIENSSFVSQHLSTSQENNSRPLICHYDVTLEHVVIRLFSDQALVAYEDLFQQIPQQVYNQDFYLCVHDGLLCLCDALNSRISVWNPATRKFRLLPQPDESLPAKVETYCYCFGFGSDPFLKDYKVVCGQCYDDLETMISGDICAVYRTSTDSWRILQRDDVDLLEGFSVMPHCSNTCVNGVYYWLACHNVEHYWKVLAFHFSKEVFQLIDWPPTTEPDALLGNLHPLHGDRISLWVNISDVTNRSFDIWVLDEERQYWTKLPRIGPLSGIQRMVGFQNEEQNKVYVQTVSGKLLIYDNDMQEYRDLGIDTGIAIYRLYVHTYEESLIATSSSRDQSN